MEQSITKEEGQHTNICDVTTVSLLIQLLEQIAKEQYELNALSIRSNSGQKPLKLLEQSYTL
jgi:hypothetical protein